jgi:hypothetical protein
LDSVIAKGSAKRGSDDWQEIKRRFSSTERENDPEHLKLSNARTTRQVMAFLGACALMAKANASLGRFETSGGSDQIAGPRDFSRPPRCGVVEVILFSLNPTKRAKG